MSGGAFTRRKSVAVPFSFEDIIGINNLAGIGRGVEGYTREIKGWNKAEKRKKAEKLRY